MEKQGSMREAMPTVAEFVDDMRRVFGAQEINAMIKRGVAGQPNTFYATENGHEIGTPFDGRPA